ncbi:GDSL esterase/lipase EXL3-like [Macadamia integrifolia]|uniref:GDSL esterase/lipase EXL3-like n=1 Tax=Macadamia integrifolia TaxID=60698 RepID=UPI001C4EB6F1|nr:GDSL esterase/lipase EXL3-like [Macadamia integrifolia]
MHSVCLIGRHGTTTGASFSSSSSSKVVGFFTFMMASCFLFQMNQAQITLPNNITIPALIAFGDSIIDAGNNNNLKTLVKCNFPPYGRDFMGGIPTGRFSNGKVPTDFLVEDLGIKELLPAYLDPTLKPSDLLTGVSFASGACGYDPLTSQMTSVLSLSDQLNLFREYIRKLKKIAGEERANSIIAESFYAICTGSDDIANTYFSTLLRSVNYDVPTYTDLMIRSASSFIQELYGLGARRIGVLDIPPIGCVPEQRTLGGGQERECAEKYNQAASLFNTKLSSLINSLNRRLPQSKIVFIDIYQPLLDIIQYPDSYGFEYVNKGCCGTGRLEVSILCNSLVPQTCQNDSKYLFWDSYHPSERAYRFLTTVILRDNINQFF